MKGHDCPYCTLAIKAGDLFCSRHANNMRDLSSGVFLIREKTLEECDWHVTRLSLNFNPDGSQTYFAGSREYSINPTKYLLINEGQSFKTSIQSENENRMLTLAFKVGLPESIFRAFSSTAENLVDDPFKTQEPIIFFEGTYALTPDLDARINAVIENPGSNDGLQERLDAILEQVVAAQFQLNTQALTIQRVKSSTRIEIFRRLQWSIEFLRENFTRSISVEDLANQACLSMYHFKRLFKEVYGEAPYQMIRRLRLERAASLLALGLPVKSVCKSVGWEDSSSFVRLFRKEMNVTPHQFKANSRHS
jgi:AraC-like DNA-binding protein